MKYAFYPGCVARGGTPELYDATMMVAEKLELELVELTRAACTGAGVLQEKNRLLGDVLNIRTLAMAEELGLTLMTICSTCQGVISQAHHRVMRDPAYLAEVNSYLKDEGLEYKGTVQAKHLMWILMEDIGVDALVKLMSYRFPDLRLAPFYGCYVVRPSDALGFGDNPGRGKALESLIKAVGATVVDFSGKTACCGFPILFINQKNSLKMVANHTSTAEAGGANAMVTPCPLCHLNLDGYQAKARKDNRKGSGTLPIIHLPQLLALALGYPADQLGLGKHFVSTDGFVKMVRERRAAAA